MRRLDLVFKEKMGARYGTQVGDQVEGVKAMYELTVWHDPPLRVVVGTDAYAAITAKLNKKYEKISNITGYGWV